MDGFLRLLTVARGLRTSLWFVPMAAGLAGIALAVVCTEIPAVVAVRHGGILFVAGPGSARQVLAALLGALITALSLISSLTVVALQTATSQYSPRMLRTFVRDTGTQAVLGAFVGSILYILVVLHDLPAGSSAHMPRLAITMAMGLVGMCTFMIAFYFHHISQAVRPEWMLLRVSGETRQTIRRVLPPRQTRRADGSDGGGSSEGGGGSDERAGTGGGSETVDRSAQPDPPADAVAVRSPANGYVQALDGERLRRLVLDDGLSVRLAVTVGEFVVEGQVLAHVWDPGAHCGRPAQRSPAEAAQPVQSAAALGRQRTMQQDIGFGFRQLVDVAVKALSPALNVPYTGVQVIDQLTALLCDIAGHRAGPVVDTGETGAVLAVPGATLLDYVRSATEEIAHYGAGDARLLCRLVSLVGTVAQRADPGDRPDLAALIDHLVAQADLPLQQDREDLRRLASQTRRTALGTDDAPSRRRGLSGGRNVADVRALGGR